MHWQLSIESLNYNWVCHIDSCICFHTLNDHRLLLLWEAFSGSIKKNAFKIHVSHNAKWQQNAISFGGPNYCVVTGQAVVKCEWKRVKEKYSFYFFIYRFNAAKCFTNCTQTITYSTPSILIHKMDRKKRTTQKKSFEVKSVMRIIPWYAVNTIVIRDSHLGSKPVKWKATHHMWEPFINKRIHVSNYFYSIIRMIQMSDRGNPLEFSCKIIEKKRDLYKDSLNKNVIHPFYAILNCREHFC